MFANCWRQILRNVFADCFHAVHTHQLELANTSLPTLVCRVKAALPEFRPVSFNKPSTKLNEKALFQKHLWLAQVSPVFPSFPYGKHCFQQPTAKHCSQQPPGSVFVFTECKLCLRYTARNFNENPSMRALLRILRTRASKHLSIFCEQFEQRPNFGSTFKLDGTISYPCFCYAYVYAYVKV